MNYRAQLVSGHVVQVDSSVSAIRSTARMISFETARAMQMIPLVLHDMGGAVNKPRYKLSVGLADGDFYDDSDFDRLRQLLPDSISGHVHETESLYLEATDFRELLGDLYSVAAIDSQGATIVIRRDTQAFFTAAHMIDHELAFRHFFLPVYVDSDETVLVVVPNDALDRTDAVKEQLGREKVRLARVERQVLTDLINAAFLVATSEEQSQLLQIFDEIMAAALRQRAKSVFLDTDDEGRTLVTIRKGRSIVPLASPHARSQPATFVRQVTNALMLAAGSQTDDDQAFDYDFSIRRNIGGKHVSFRGASLPASGETLVIRITGQATQFSADRIGFLPEQLERIPYIVERTGGAVIASAPPGHGKSTLIRMMLGLYHDANPDRRIYAAENPVEHHLSFVRHVNMERALRLTFARLREQFVRMECDVLFLGEMRSDETYHIAFEFAEATDKFFGTTHAFDVPLTLHELFERSSRLNVAMHIDTIIGQRLVQTLCPTCAETVPLNPEGQYARYHRPFVALVNKYMPHATATKVKRPKVNAGCGVCSKGYLDFDRPVFEIFEMNDEAREAILRGADPYEIVKHDPLYQPMIVHAMQLVLNGSVSIETMFRSVRTDMFRYTAKEKAPRVA